ncbi:hypothetical protein LCGC14_0774220 [marine sediment metagenome]|uniref:Uncharacterized protein n=1 Tax=marine sediment metagenome TaxID=412755 RepID=A0A0F9Q1L7_9ZZZZ
MIWSFIIFMFGCLFGLWLVWLAERKYQEKNGTNQRGKDD